MITEQVYPQSLPDWTAVTVELADLLERFFGE